jgi:hypothetical protein
MTILLPLSDNEERVVRRALNGLWHNSNRQADKNRRKGWKPAPGRIDIHEATMDTLDAIFARLNELNPRGEGR